MFRDPPCVLPHQLNATAGDNSKTKYQCPQAILCHTISDIPQIDPPSSVWKQAIHWQGLREPKVRKLICQIYFPWRWSFKTKHDCTVKCFHINASWMLWVFVDEPSCQPCNHAFTFKSSCRIQLAVKNSVTRMSWTVGPRSVDHKWHSNYMPKQMHTCQTP